MELEIFENSNVSQVTIENSIYKEDLCKGVHVNNPYQEGYSSSIEQSKLTWTEQRGLRI